MHLLPHTSMRILAVALAAVDKCSLHNKRRRARTPIDNYLRHCTVLVQRDLRVAVAARQVQSRTVLDGACSRSTHNTITRTAHGGLDLVLNDDSISHQLPGAGVGGVCKSMNARYMMCWCCWVQTHSLPLLATPERPVRTGAMRQRLSFSWRHRVLVRCVAGDRPPAAG